MNKLELIKSVISVITELEVLLSESEITAKTSKMSNVVEYNDGKSVAYEQAIVLLESKLSTLL